MIGIFTLSASDNCGSCLQAYALKTILEELSNEDVEIINFTTKESHFQYDILPVGKLKYVKETFFRIININKLKFEKNSYKRFRKNYLNINVEIEIYPQDLNKISTRYRMVFFGSDQIWNVKMSDFNKAFFGGWTDKPKIAISASMGGHDIEEAREYKEFLNNIEKFKLISVREKKAKLCLERNLKKTIPVLLDPTLLLKTDDWLKLIGEPIVKEKYIFYYSWGYCCNETMQIVKEVNSDLKLPIYVIDSHKWVKQKPDKKGFIMCKEQGPLAFLNLMYYSSLSYVESFHGAIFAYIFKKNFWVLDTHFNYDEIDARLKELIELFNVQNRILTPYNYSDINVLQDIDYQNKIDFDDRRTKTIEFISEGLNKV